LSKLNYIDRPPRIQPELPEGQYPIPNPPDVVENTSQPLLQLALPMATILGYLLVSMLGKGRSLLLMIPMGIAVVASSLLSLYTIRRNKQLREERDRAYFQRLVELRKEMESYHDMQRLFYHYNYPEPDMPLRMAADIRAAPSLRQEDIRSGSRLWERRPTDKDFGVLRLGSGTVPSTVTYTLQRTQDMTDPRLNEALRLEADSRYVSDVPIVIPLREPPSDRPGEEAGIARHAIGISGSEPSCVYDYVRSLLVDFTAFHSPNDTHLYIIGSNEARPHWRWAYPLPHCKEGQAETLCFEEDVEKKADKEQEKLSLFWKNLRNLLERRKIRLQDEKDNPEITLPFLLVVVDTLHPLPDWSTLQDLESNATVSLILKEGRQLGAAILFLVSGRNKVPSPCQAVIEVETSPTQGAVFRYAEVGINSARYVGRAQLIPGQEPAREFARALEPLAIRRSYGADLATSVTLLEMLGLSSIEELQKFAQENWRRSKDPKNADWLNVSIGLLSGNEVRKLVFSAKGDGVHGMVAGSTGSGKSELLMTLIMGLAINYDPSVVNFVLVDYKGGAAFEPFRDLPHVVDIVTNLEGSATGRMFSSIKAELDRRQRLNTYSDSKDIVHYYKKGLHRQEGSPPYPFLFIIIDEFAEMIAGNAEFKSQLESITRLGRALGVHLILAAQRPAGVTDQMRANIKFRICLRVETPDDSRELLRRSDAAFLPPGIPGRGYLQIGNENIELIQVGYIGGDYRGPQENVSPDVIWLNRPKKSDSQKAKEEAPKLYDVAVNRLASLAKGENVPPQWRPWPAFLPRNYSLQTPMDTAYMTEADVALLRMDEIGEAAGGPTMPVTQPEPGTPASDKSPLQTAPRLPLNKAVTAWLSGNHRWNGIDWATRAMRPIVGIIDNPYEARQLPLIVNFPIGHAVLFGASGWGKTSFLRTLLVSLFATHSPDELHVYILDFGGRNFIQFKDFPHVGAVVTADEDERVLRLLRKISNIVERRQTILSEAGVPDLYAYNQKHASAPLPAVLVALDNFAGFKENFENYLPALIALVREARSVGVHFVVTGDQANALPNKLFSLFTERMTLRLSDPSEYTTIVGRGVPDMGHIAGRGFVRVGRTPMEFQVALPLGGDESESGKRVDEAEQLRKLAQNMTAAWGAAWKGEPPATIETLPIKILLEKLLERRTPPSAKRIMPTLGVDDLNLELYHLDLQRQGPHLVVIGPANSGKTTTLRTLALSLADSYSPAEVMLVLIDFQRRFFEYGGKHNLGQLPHVVQTISRAEQIDEFVANLKYECKDFEANPTRPRIYVLIDNYDSFSDDGTKKSRKAFEEMAVLAREMGTAGLHFVGCGSLGWLSASDDLRKQIQSSNFGLALLSGDAVNKLNGKVPRSLAEAELPIGRGFVVKSGRTMMMQLATPYANDEAIEASLDEWVERLLQKYPGPRAAWLRPADAASADEGSAPPQPVSPRRATPPPAPPPPAPKSVPKVTAQDVDVEALKVKLRAAGLTENLLNNMSIEAMLAMVKRLETPKPAESNPKAENAPDDQSPQSGSTSPNPAEGEP